MDEIPAGVRDARAGGEPINARITRRMVEMFAQRSPPPAEYGLTDRERAVLDLMVRGLIKKQTPPGSG